MFNNTLVKNYYMIIAKVNRKKIETNLDGFIFKILIRLHGVQTKTGFGSDTFGNTVSKFDIFQKAESRSDQKTKIRIGCSILYICTIITEIDIFILVNEFTRELPARQEQDRIHKVAGTEKDIRNSCFVDTTSNLNIFKVSL